MSDAAGHGVDRTPTGAWRPIRVFVAVAYAIAWAWWVPMALRGSIVETGQGWPTHLVGLMAPAIAAVVATGAFGGAAGLADLGRRCLRWRIDPRAYGIIALTGVIGLVPVLLSNDPDWSAFGRYSGAPRWGVATVVVVLIVNGFGEEVGWRGFLWDRLLPMRGFRDSAVLVWLIWGAWHLPLFWVVANYRGFGPLGIAGWVVSLFFGAVFLGWFYEFTGRSVLAVVAWHVTYNFSVATDATSDVGAAVVSAGVVVAGLVIMRTGGGGTTRSSDPTPPG